jgi:hypothetical protein
MPYRRDRTSNGNYDIHFLAYKLRGDFSVALGTSFRPLILDRNSSPVDPAELAQARDERSDPWSKGDGIGQLAAPPTSTMKSRRLMPHPPYRCRLN